MQPEYPQPENLPPAPVSGSGTPARSRHSLRDTFSTIGLLLLAPLIAVFLTLFVFQSYQVEGISMERTLQDNDRLVVWKLPRSWAKVTGHSYIPNRGDIVILNESGLRNFGNPEDEKQLVKRVIGLPGDRIVIEGGEITVYNQEHPQGFKPDTTLPYGANNAIPSTPNDLEVEVGEDQLYVCGDNRPNSLDSRSFGPIDADQIVGKLVLRIMPLTSMQRF